jgi:release factor H-coupled RctB family protein
MSCITITLCLNDNKSAKKIVSVTNAITYNELLKLATNKFRQKILTIFNGDNEIFDVGEAESGQTYFCSTKLLDVKPATSNLSKSVIIQVIAKNSYIQDDAINQLENLRLLEGVTHIFGMPDLHVGGGIPIGSTTITNGKIHPHLIGDDIGCGMCLTMTNLKSNISSKAIKKLSQLLNLEVGEPEISEFDLSGLTKYDGLVNMNILTKSMGTIGRGNHFAELQVVDKIYDELLSSQFGIDPSKIFLTVHSGSRGFGENILELYQKGCVDMDGYKELHNIALDWAYHNRQTITKRFCDQIGVSEYIGIADMYHNFYEEKDGMVIHRKGAAPCKLGKLIVIPGSRGAKTYVVLPLKSDITHGYSVSHGAGRKVSRHKAVDIMNGSSDLDKQKKLYSDETIDNIVICENKELFCEEAPFVYKDIDVVINDLVELGLVKVVMSLKPIITYKMKCNC